MNLYHLNISVAATVRSSTHLVLMVLMQFLCVSSASNSASHTVIANSQYLKFKTEESAGALESSFQHSSITCHALSFKLRIRGTPPVLPCYCKSMKPTDVFGPMILYAVVIHGKAFLSSGCAQYSLHGP
ncbi:hypothetical protein BDP27DRAFT_1064862 [Rhodocollybia butyracea]|uniref:Uncharacterized protein n=1 Tax=Rhodocollybia butyracea TaxID=206335 RepID=A0A9P5PLA7_9AGAR|nr:hypothetical protein BDP27DRAFT_1064862 [Rhodocollybia butyracea]